MSKPYLAVYKNGICSSITPYSDADQATADHHKIMDAYHGGFDKNTQSALIYASDDDSVGVKVGDHWSDSDDLDLRDFID